MSIRSLDTIELSQNGLVASLVLNRPKKRNAFDDTMVREITEAFEKFERVSQPPRVVVISSRGEAFCAGADLSWMKRMADYSFEENIEDARKLSNMLETIHASPFCVIARVHGLAFGGGIGLAAAADFVVASTSARFAFTEVLLGLRPSTISLYCIPRLGVGRARDLFCSGRNFTANEAKEYGLVDALVADEMLDSTVAREVARAIEIGKSGMRTVVSARNDVPDEDPVDPNAARELLAMIHEVDDALRLGTPQKRQELREFLARDIAAARVSKEAQTKMRDFLERLKSR